MIVPVASAKITASAICSRIASASEDASSTSSLLLWNTALRVEIADMAALRPRGRIDRAIDQGRFPRSERLGERLREPLRFGGIVTDTAEGFAPLFVPGFFHQGRGHGVGATTAVDSVAAIDSAVVEEDVADRQRLAADGVDPHAAEAE